MDLIERAAQRLSWQGLGTETKKRRAPALVEVSGRVPANQVPPASQESGTGFEAGHRHRPQGERRQSPGIGRPHKIVEIDKKHLRAFQDVLLTNGQRSEAAESFRHIKRGVLNLSIGGSFELPNVILITSARQNEGKTHIALNLALSLALERDLTAILVDADLRRSDVTKRLGIKSDRGLFDYLDDPSIGIPDIHLGTNIDQLSIVPAGRWHDKSTELLASSRMRHFIEELVAHRPDRMVILDGSPLLATSEAAVLTRNVGQVLFVVEAGATSHAEVEHALNLIDDRPEVSFVLNKARTQIGEINASSYYYTY